MVKYSTAEEMAEEVRDKDAQWFSWKVPERITWAQACEAREWWYRNRLIDAGLPPDKAGSFRTFKEETWPRQYIWNGEMEHRAEPDGTVTTRIELLLATKAGNVAANQRGYHNFVDAEFVLAQLEGSN